MPLTSLAPEISVTGQLVPDQMAAVKAAGFRAVVNARPDGEEAGQPTSSALAAAAANAGIAYHHIPVVPGRYDSAAVAAFRGVLDGVHVPVLAFCRSGLRAASLWALSQVGQRSPEEIRHRSRDHGYDLTPLATRLRSDAPVRGDERSPLVLHQERDERSRHPDGD